MLKSPLLLIAVMGFLFFSCGKKEEAKPAAKAAEPAKAPAKTASAAKAPAAKVPAKAAASGEGKRQTRHQHQSSRAKPLHSVPRRPLPVV